MIIKMDFQLNVMRVFVIGVDNVSVGSEWLKIGSGRVTGGERAVLGAGIGSWGLLRRGDGVGGWGRLQKNLTVQLQFHFEKTLFKHFFFFCPVLRSNKIYIVHNHLIDNI